MFTHMTSDIIQAERPRDVGILQSTAILYGDWGTSKLYVIGLAFALAGYASFWLLVGVSLLILLVGINYILICKCYPNGGGVYASARSRSKVVALVGGIFLIADYLVTAALSALAAFSYLGVVHPVIWSIVFILLITALNYLGPRKSGNFAFVIAVLAFVTVVLLGIAAFYHIPQSIQELTHLPNAYTTWTDFVAIVVGLSGIEAIANTTSVMRLDPGSTRQHPSVIRTAAPAIIMVMIEVAFFTLLLGLAANGLPGLTVEGGEVSAPGYPNVRDSMLRYMGESYVGELLGSDIGMLFGYISSIFFAALLLSAVNTAIVALNSLLYVMSHDGQFPRSFQRLNKFGVPVIPLYIVGLAPVLVLLFVNDMTGLANLYAIGFIGAIATNLASTSSDFSLSLQKYERIFMFVTFLILFVIEITLFIDKPEARAYVISILAGGLFLRALVMEQKEKRQQVRSARLMQLAEKSQQRANFVVPLPAPKAVPATDPAQDHIHSGAILCVATDIFKGLEFAIHESEITKQPLYILFIREQKLMVNQDLEQSWLDDEGACRVFDYVLMYAKDFTCTFLYDVSDAPAINILAHAQQLKVNTVILGTPRHSKLLRFIRGNVVDYVKQRLPPNIDLIVVS